MDPMIACVLGVVAAMVVGFVVVRAQEGVAMKTCEAARPRGNSRIGEWCG